MLNACNTKDKAKDKAKGKEEGNGKALASCGKGNGPPGKGTDEGNGVLAREKKKTKKRAKDKKTLGNGKASNHHHVCFLYHL